MTGWIEWKERDKTTLEKQIVKPSLIAGKVGQRWQVLAFPVCIYPTGSRNASWTLWAAPVVELSVMLNKHQRWTAQPSARDMHKSREGRAIQHVYNAGYMGKSNSTSLKSSRKRPENRAQWAEISVPIISNVNNHTQGTPGSLAVYQTWCLQEHQDGKG